MVKIINAATNVIAALTIFIVALFKMVDALPEKTAPNNPFAKLASYFDPLVKWFVINRYVPPAQQQTPSAEAPKLPEKPAFYVYYEEKNGRETAEDGRLVPVNSTVLPPYSNLHIGAKLKALDEVSARFGPSGKYSTNGAIFANQCVEIVEVGYSIPTRDATSGGYFGVKRSAC